jgi:hypothetical protein
VHPPFGSIELLQRWLSFCERIVLSKIAAEMPKPLVLNRSIRRGWVGPLEELGATEQIMTKLAVQETAILPFHVNVPGINSKGERP